ncbi:MAG: tetratricopeptide repeat protein [Crocinitomicaceae bacterium]
MKSRLKYIGICAFVLVFIYACSTEKNTAINRAFHGMNAHYNGYFNANELLRQSMETYNNSLIEDYYAILPIDPVPNEEEVLGMYPAIDTAISKCTKVIRDHSMPGNDKPSKKKAEHNRWIDENWTTVGQSLYLRRDYEGAMKNFKFIYKFYSNDPSLYIGELWMAKTNISTGDLTKAQFNLDNLDKAIKAEEESKNQKPSKTRSKSSKKKAKEDKTAKFPKKIRFDFEKTKADLALKKDNKEDAIKYLEESLKYARKSRDEARVHFILGQLYEERGSNQEASDHYAKVLKKNALFQMSFNARLKKSFLGNSTKKKKELKKMLRDAKNAEFKDQIYYALAGIEFNEGNEPKGIDYLHQCAFYSTKNTRQKGMAYERLGDMSFQKRNYVSAQKYYDSCANVITDAYPNAEAIRNKASNLADLVVAVETATYEDSVQRIAALSEGDRENFLKDHIKKTKEEEQRKKERDAERLRELQSNENLFAQNGNGSKWYWNNAKTRAAGYDEFKKMWGSRENEDNWRRSEKTFVPDFKEDDEGEIVDVKDTIIEVEDKLSVEYLTANLPLSDSALALSNERLLKAHYDAGIIYKEQLNEVLIAKGEFQAVLDRKVENPHNLMSAFELYKILESSNPEEAQIHKDYILNYYPNSDYANYLRDPNYFIKKKERDKLAEQEYVTVLERYNRGLYYPVISKADIVIVEERDNVFRAKYMLLKALSMGQINEDKTTLLPVLDSVVLEFPGTFEATKAKEMIEVIKNGYSKNIEADFGSKFPFAYNDRAIQWVIIFLPEDENSSAAKTKMIDFHREFFSRDKLKVNSKIYGSQSVILINDFETEADGAEYIRVFKTTRKYLLDLQNAKILMITQENLKILYEKQNLAEYEKFYEEYY